MQIVVTFYILKKPTVNSLITSAKCIIATNQANSTILSADTNEINVIFYTFYTNNSEDAIVINLATNNEHAN